MATTLDKDLVQHLLDQSAITDRVSARIHPGGNRIPGDTLPAITVRMISSVRGHSHDGANGLVSARYQIDVWAATEEERIIIADAVRESLDGRSSLDGDTTVSAIFMDSDSTSWDDDVNVSRQSTDYIIHYREDRPTF